MNQPDDLQRAIAAVSKELNKLGVKFHFTGGISVLYFGAPRFTRDIDVVLSPEGPFRLGDPRFKDFCSKFEIEPATFLQALKRGGLVQGVEPETLFKLDFYLRESIPGELDRSVTVEVFPGLSVPLVCAVDAVLAKVLWVGKGSHKSREDLRSMYPNLSSEERERLAVWSEQLGYSTLLHQVLSEQEPSE